MSYLVPRNAIGATLRLYYEDVASQACGKMPRALPRIKVLWANGEGMVNEMQIKQITAYDFYISRTSDNICPTAVIMDVITSAGLQKCIYWYYEPDKDAFDWISHRIFDPQCIKIRDITLDTP